MIGRTIVLLLLIAILSVGGIIWFDYLNVIDAKSVLAPIYERIPFAPGIGRIQPKTQPDEILDLNSERLAVRLEQLELLNLEIDTKKRDLDNRDGEIEQKAQELEERQKALEEWENTLKAQVADAENKDRNVEQNARYLTGMPPQNAVGIIAKLDDQDAIDVLRKTEEIARAEGTTSVVAYWFSLMEPGRAAELQRKMAGRPPKL
ncbi:MAG: flagellar protein FlbB [Treponema sp.]|jgi:flagellar protein FlbB|nr:flagellar protein FlbB [Treponema sp.]